LSSLLLVSSTSVWAQTQTLSPELNRVLQSATPDQELRIIVTLSDKADLSLPQNERLRRYMIIHRLKRKAGLSQGPLLAYLRGQGAKNIVPLWIDNAIVATVPAQAVSAIARQLGVQRIKLDKVLDAPRSNYDTLAVPEWNIDLIRARNLWALGHTGQGIVVASMDTGVDIGHPDLANRWRGGNNSWLDLHGEHPTPYDADGHGTQTMGLILGGDVGGTAIGVAPGARWIAVKLFNDARQALLSGIHQGFQWLLDPDGNPLTDDAPDVVNNSWGFGDNADACILEFQQDIQALKAAGIAVVFAAGNAGPNPLTSVSPGYNPESFSVGAVDNSRTVASFSSRGLSACGGAVFPEVVAPGVNVRTADLSLGGIALYTTVSGTSFAAPHVSGAMALLMSAFPSKTVPELEAALQQSAVDLGRAGADNDYGHGLINVAAAYRLLLRGTQNPVAIDDAYSVFEDGMLDIAAPGVLVNDSDPNDDPLSAILVNGPANGRLTLNINGSLNYTPDPGFTGTDSFTYKASDGSLDSSVTTVTLTVDPINDRQ
jgi:bacillopeptidase F